MSTRNSDCGVTQKIRKASRNPRGTEGRIGHCGATEIVANVCDEATNIVGKRASE